MTRSRHDRYRCIAALAIVASTAITAATACDDSSADDAADGKYLGHLEKRGVPTGPTNGAPPMLGHAICTDIDNGSQAAVKVLQVANLNDSDQFTVPQAEEIVYWAITDLCPVHVDQLQEHWRDGN